MKVLKNDVLIGVDELVLICQGISIKSIYESVRRFNAGESSSWANIKTGAQRKRHIYYSTIPNATRNKYKLPPLSEMIEKAVIEQEVKQADNKDLLKRISHIEIEEYFSLAEESGFVKYTPFYNKYYPENSKKVIELATEHALKAVCVELNARRPKIKLKDIFEAQKELPYKWVISNYDKFTEQHKNWRKNGINVLHGSFGKPRQYLVKLTPYVQAVIEKYYKHPNQYTIEQITELVNQEISKKNLKTISKASVSGYVTKPENQNRLMMYRNTEVFNRKVQPIMRRKNLRMAGDLYYADGTPLQIPCWNREMTKEIRLNLFAVIDVKTKKVVGFDLAESEDRYNVLSAIKMSFEMEGIVPFELKYDNASATKTEEFQELKSMLELKGCLFTPTKKGNPQEKSQVERLFGTFQTSYQRMIDGFMGEGIRSKRDNGRINADFVNSLRTKDNLYTYESMVVIVTNLINIYNQTSKSKRPSPSSLFAECEKLRASKVDASDIAMLFWKHKNIKVSRGEIATTIRRTDYYYSIWDNELKLKLSGQTVKMYYDENDLSSVHVFSLKGEYMCECRQAVMVHEGKAGQTEADVVTLIKQAKHNESIKTTIKKKTADMRKKAMEETGDDFLNMLNPYQVAKEKYNNSEGKLLMDYVLDRKNIDRNRIREYEPVNTELNDYIKNKKTDRKKKSPMAVEGHKISLIEVEDI